MKIDLDAKPTFGYYGFAKDKDGQERLMWVERTKSAPKNTTVYRHPNYGTHVVFSLWLATTGTFNEMMALCGELNGQGEILPPQASQIVGPVL